MSKNDLTLHSGESTERNRADTHDLQRFYPIQYSPIKKDYNNLTQRINIKNKKIKIYGARKIKNQEDNSK